MAKVEFVKLIGTWPGGGQFVQCEYKVIFEKEVVLLHLQIVKESPEYLKMGEPSQREIDEDFKRSEKGQEKFFRGKGKKMVMETLIRVGGIEEIRKLGFSRIRDSYFSHSRIATLIIKDIEKRN